jgi:hypothetical protein
MMGQFIVKSFVDDLTLKAQSNYENLKLQRKSLALEELGE